MTCVRGASFAVALFTITHPPSSTFKTCSAGLIVVTEHVLFLSAFHLEYHYKVARYIFFRLMVVIVAMVINAVDCSVSQSLISFLNSCFFHR